MNVRTLRVVVGFLAVLTHVAHGWAPVASNDTYSVMMNAVLSNAAPGVLANDTDKDGNKLSALLATTTSNGVLAFKTNGSFTYKPASNFFGADAFTYRAFDGKLTSAIATATINVKPLPVAVTKSPTNILVCPGSAGTFTVVVSGTAPRFQWRFGTNTLPGQTNDTLIVPADSAATAGTYSVVVTGAAGNSITNSAMLSLYAPAAATPLTNAVRSIGGVVIFSSTASGTGPFTYQWSKNGRNLIGKTNNSLLLTNLVAGDAGTYAVAVAGKCNIATRSATLVVDYCFPSVDVAVVLDRSGSMKGTPYADTLAAGSNFVKTLKLGGTNDQAALISYATTPTLNQALTNSLPAMLDAIDALPDANGYTCISCAIQMAQAELASTRRNPDALPVMVLLSDGQPSNGDTDAKAVQAATAAKNAGTRIFTVGFGDVEDSLMAAIASKPSDYFHATNSSQLAALFKTISEIICRAPTNISVIGLTNQTVCSGGDVALSVTASNCASFTYQWRKGGTNLAGQTNPTLTIHNAKVADSGVYSVIVASSCQTLTNSAVLTVNQSVLVNTPPTNQSSVLGSNATFTIEAIGAGLTYHWLFNGALVGSERVLTLNNLKASDAGTYCVVVSGTCGAPITNCAALSLNNRPPIANDDVGNDGYRTLEDAPLAVAAPGVLANDVDADGDALTAELVTGPAHGTLSLSGDGSFTYSPAADFFGNDLFTYRANDGKTSSAPATVMITIAPVNDAPSFSPGPNQRVNFNAGAQTISWAKNIRSGPANESNQVVHFNISSDNPALFSVQPSIDAQGVLTFTPTGVGVAQVSVTLQDDGGTANGGTDSSPTAVFTITLNGPPFVNILSPTNGAVFIGTNTISVVAEAGDLDGVVTNVQIFQGTNRVGNFTNEPYAVVLNDVPPNTNPYQFRAVAIDDLGLSATSSVVTVIVTQSPPVTALGPIALNRQNGMFEQYVRINNPTPHDFLGGVRLFVSLGGGTNDRVYNAAGTNSFRIPYIDVHTPVLSGGFADVLVQYYVANARVIPNVSLSAEPLPFLKTVPPAPILIAAGPAVTAPFRFNSVRGQIYLVQWSPDLKQWHTAPGLTTGTGASISLNPPGTASCRFCRVLMLP